MILPAELIAIILEQLDITTIQRCRQVSRTIRDLIDTSVAIQYKIELAVAGMEDGPPGNICPADRLMILKEHQRSWHNLAWKKDHVVSMSRHESVCRDGVLANVLDESCRSLVVRQLPSVVRGIKETEWRVDMNFSAHDFTFDPSQDLLAVIEMVYESTVLIHACTLSTGKQHSLSASVGRFIHTSPNVSPNRSYTLHICGDLLAIDIDHHCSFHNLMIWNWKTGDLKLDVPGPMHSFSFLSEQYVMRAFTYSKSGDSTMRLDIFDLGRVRDHEALCSFRFPVIGSVWPPYTKMWIRSNATSGRTSHSYGSVPFSTSQSDRLYLVSCTSDSGMDPSLVLFVHLSTILEKIANLPPRTKGRQFTWAQWGEGARLLHLPPWMRITHVHGTKFALIRNKQLEVYDFNKLSVKRNRIRARSDLRFTGSYSLGAEFVGPDCSCLPYDMRAIPISDCAGINSIAVQSVFLTEDSLILIPLAPYRDYYHILTF